MRKSIVLNKDLYLYKYEILLIVQLHWLFVQLFAVIFNNIFIIRDKT